MQNELYCLGEISTTWCNFNLILFKIKIIQFGCNTLPVILESRQQNQLQPAMLKVIDCVIKNIHNVPRVHFFSFVLKLQ